MSSTVKIANKPIGPYGFGLMGLTWRPTPTPHPQAFAAMRAALEQGANFWNAGEFYGTPENNSLTLLRAYFTEYPADAAKVVLSVKGAVGPDARQPDGSPAGVRRSIENCNRMLGGTKTIDVFECARKDPQVEIEVTVKALADLVQEGLIGGIALSEVGPETIKRAAAVAPIAAVETEVSLWEDNAFASGIVAACAAYAIPLVAYSPLGRGMLTGQVRSPEDIPEGDIRRHMPRYSPENFPRNMELVEKLEGFAKGKGCTPAQLALGWVHGLGRKAGNPVFVPIPGATTEARVRENMKIVDLSAAEEAEIDKILESFVVQGTRYPEQAMGLLNA